MFNLISYNNENKTFKFLNILLLILFAWVIFNSSSYMVEKVIFGKHDNFYDLKLVYNSLVGLLNGEDIYKVYPPYYDQPKSAYPPYTFNLIKTLGKLDWEVFLRGFIFLQMI